MDAERNHDQMGWFLVCWMVCLPTVVEGAAASLTTYKPSWRVGQKWYVEVETRTQPPGTARRVREKFVPKKITYGHAFTVEALEEVESEPCYRLRMRLVTINGNEIKPSPLQRRVFYRIFTRADDSSLKMIQRFNERTGNLEASIKYSRGPVQDTSWIGSLPLCFPVFSKEAQKYRPPDPPEPNATTVRKEPQSWQKQEPAKDAWVVNGTEQSALTVTLFRGQPDSKMGPERTQQIWVKGMPWPIRTDHTYGHNPPLRAKLIRVDGSRIVAAPKPQSQQECFEEVDTHAADDLCFWRCPCCGSIARVWLHASSARTASKLENRGFVDGRNMV